MQAFDEPKERAHQISSLIFRNAVYVVSINFLNCVAEPQTCESLGTINEELNISNTQSVSGLYLLGNVPNNGTIQSVCAFGKIDTSLFNGSIEGREMVGTIQIYVIPEVLPNGSLSSEFRMFLRQSSDSLLRACRDVDIRVRSSDLIVVYIPNLCTMNDERIQCPLRINFQNDSSSTGYYNGSDTLFDVFGPSHDRVRTVVLDQQPVPVDTFLNVQVTLKGIELITHHSLKLQSLAHISAY